MIDTSRFAIFFQVPTCIGTPFTLADLRPEAQALANMYGERMWIVRNRYGHYISREYVVSGGSTIEVITVSEIVPLHKTKPSTSVDGIQPENGIQPGDPRYEEGCINNRAELEAAVREMDEDADRRDAALARNPAWAQETAIELLASIGVTGYYLVRLARRTVKDVESGELTLEELKLHK